MTKQEAIEILEKHKSFYEGKVFTPFQAKDIICAYDVLIAESKNPIYFNKLRDEDYVYCECENPTLGSSITRCGTCDNWFKKKLTG